MASGGETFDYRKRERVGEAPRDNGGQFTLRVFRSTKPVIAAINGPAVGVGATMTLPMDVRLAADDARIGFVFARRGIIPEACSSWFLPRVVGISRAMEWSQQAGRSSLKRGWKEDSYAACTQVSKGLPEIMPGWNEPEFE